MRIEVLRLDHRKKRDVRISTHVCLTARAFGASKVYLTGDKDVELMKNVSDLVKQWGGSFEVVHGKSYMDIMEECQGNGGEVVHLTMYGLRVQDVIKDIRESSKDKLIVVGGSRVPRKVYKKADWNVSVTNQPHSEVSSLAVFQHMLLDGGEFEVNFSDSVFEVIPMPEGKKIDIKKSS